MPRPPASPKNRSRAAPAPETTATKGALPFATAPKKQAAAPRAAKGSPATVTRTVTKTAATATAAGAGPKPPRRAPRAKAPAADIVPALAGGAALASPVWIPGLDTADRGSRVLAFTLGVSIALHAVLLAIRFQPFDLQQLLDRGPPLEIALVNAKSPNKPTKADILAQANLDGGGNTDAARRAKTPLPVPPKDSPNSELSVATQQVQTLERQTKELITRLKSAPTALAAPRPTEASQPSDIPTSMELMQRTLEAMRLEAQIAKDMDAYQKRPKRRFVGARAEEYRFARYVEDWRLKVERVGNLNYPEAARQQKLYGNLLITVSIRADGSVERIEINRSSGRRVLDAAAVHIVEMAAPFAPLPSDIRRDTDILHITRTWTFTKGDELHSE